MSEAARPASKPRAQGALARIARHVPPGQLARFLAVGIVNTAFGYGTFALLTWLIDDRIPLGYVAAGLASSLLNVTFSFLGYKWFVFRTRGNYVREWLRCLGVYGSGILVGTAVLPPTVFLLRWALGMDRGAPYAAAALLTLGNAAYSFVLNRRFTFRVSAAESHVPDPSHASR